LNNRHPDHVFGEIQFSRVSTEILCSLSSISWLQICPWNITCPN
jgi:hypothetical protein